MRWVHPDGRVVWAEHRRVPIRDARGKLVAIEGIARDITDLVEAQRQLRTSQDQLRRLAASIQTAREEERATLARELHDELGQTLTALKLELARTVNVLKESSVNTDTMNRLQVPRRAHRHRRDDGQAHCHESAAADPRSSGPGRSDPLGSRDILARGAGYGVRLSQKRKGRRSAWLSRSRCSGSFRRR